VRKFMTDEKQRSFRCGDRIMVHFPGMPSYSTVVSWETATTVQTASFSYCKKSGKGVDYAGREGAYITHADAPPQDAQGCPCVPAGAASGAEVGG